MLTPLYPLARRTALALSLPFAPLLQAASPTDPATDPTGETQHTLQGLVVTATASARTQDTVPASVSVIDGETLRRQPMLDLADAVRGSTGINLENTGLGRRGISIRGMSSEHTLILIDGQRVNTSSAAIAHSDYELSWVPADAIDRIEVVRGPLSSLYGSEALGGVVNIITRPASDTWQGSLSAYTVHNSHDLGGHQHKTGFQLSGPLRADVLHLNIWGEFKHRQALVDASDPTLSALDRQLSQDLHLGLDWTPDAQQKISFALDSGNEDRRGYRSSSGVIYSSEDDVERQRLSLSHSGDWSWGNSLVRLYRSSLQRDNERSDGGTLSGPNRFTDTVLEGRGSWNLTPDQRLTLGIETRREKLEDPTVTLSGEEALTHNALYLQDEILFGDQWELVLGNRFDHHSAFGWETSPRAYLLYHPSEQLTLKLGAGGGFKAPTLKQLSAEYESRAAMGGRGIIRGNPDLEPETNSAFELGLDYHPGDYRVGATLFRNDVKNLIETVRQASCYEAGKVCLEYENLDQVRLQGLELSASAPLADNWQLDANYTYLDARDRLTDERLAERSRHSANATLRWQARERLETRMRAEYTGSQYRSASESDRPGYTLLHWYVDYALSPRLDLQAGIENLTDKQLANDDASLYSRADEGRRYFAGLTLSF